MDLPIWLLEHGEDAQFVSFAVLTLLAVPLLPMSFIAGRLRRRIVSQFHRPHGLVGRLAGFVMAHRPSNRQRNLWTVGLLEIAPSHRVLELGSGPAGESP